MKSKSFGRTVGSLAAALVALVPLTAAPVSAASAPRPIVMVVGGIGSTFNNAADWGLLGDDVPGGFDWAVYSYAGNNTSSYTATQTCQSLATSEGLLKQEVDALRPGHSSVILVGHSLGGVLAFDVGTRPDEADFVSKVITIDAPLGGLHSYENFFGSLGMNDGNGCEALTDLRNRSLNASWLGYLTGQANAALSRGVGLKVITNTADGAVDAAEQGINGANVNLLWNVVDSGFNHSAVLHDVASMVQIAQFITS